MHQDRRFAKRRNAHDGHGEKLGPAGQTTILRGRAGGAISLRVRREGDGIGPTPAPAGPMGVNPIMAGQGPESQGDTGWSTDVDTRPSLYERVVLFVLAYLTLGGMAVGLVTATGLVFDLATWLWLPLDAVIAIAAVPGLWLMLRPAARPQSGPLA